MTLRNRIRLGAGIALLTLNSFFVVGCTTETVASGTLQSAVVDGVTTGLTDALATLVEVWLVTLAT